MRTKKLLILTAAGFTFSCTLASGAGMYTSKAPFPMTLDSVGVYIEGLAGYNRYDFKEALHSGLSWDNGSGNWAFAADIGYQFHQYLSVELGGIYTFGTKEAGVKHRPWYAYLAGKLSMAVYDNISVFAKMGAGYQKLIDDGGDNQNNWGPMFGVGLAYHFTPQFYIQGQWLRFTGKVREGIPKTSAPNIFLLGLGYKFSM